VFKPVSSYTRLGVLDMSSGSVTPVGNPFVSQWTQTGVQATISSVDRCNLFFTHMYNVVGTSPNLNIYPVFAAVDMTTGNLAFAVQLAASAGSTLAYAP
jgi:hypothetical protein